jgi:hypothetical protein
MGRKRREDKFAVQRTDSNRQHSTHISKPEDNIKMVFKNQDMRAWA